MKCDELQLYHSITRLANILSHTVIDLTEFLSMINMRFITIFDLSVFFFFHFHSVHSVLKESLMPRLGELSAEKGADTDQRVLEAYQMQCVAEAQEGQSRIIHVADTNHNDLLNLLTSNHQLTA